MSCLTSEIRDEILKHPRSRLQIILPRLKSDRSVLSGGTLSTCGYKQVQTDINIVVPLCEHIMNTVSW